MDPQIGTDIAKLLGSLNKSEAYSGSLASRNEAGAAFKRALVASEQAQAAETSGKGLPAASASTTPSREPVDPPVAGSVASMPAAERVSTTSLPGFDLHVVGEPAERLAVMKYVMPGDIKDASGRHHKDTSGRRQRHHPEDSRGHCKALLCNLSIFHLFQATCCFI